MFKISLISLTFCTLAISQAQDFPVTVEHEYGSTTIRAAPERIVTLGFSVPDFVDALPKFGMLSEERYDLLEQDVTVVLEDQPGDRARLDADPLFNPLEVVQEGRAVVLGGVTSLAIAFNTVLSLPYALEGFLPELSAAVARLEPN